MAHRCRLSMKIKEGFKLRKVCDSVIVVAVGSASIDLNGMITLNETGEFLWNLLTEGCTEKELTTALSEEYDINVRQAETDVRDFVSGLERANLVE